MIRVSKVNAKTLHATVHASVDGTKTVCGRTITGLRGRWFVLGSFRSARWQQHEVTCEKCVERMAR